MKILTAAVVGAISLLTTSGSLAQGGNMMNGNAGGGGWMGGGYGGWMGGGYGGFWVPVLVVVLIGVVVWAVLQRRK
ncbi:MAG: hypothetical protein ABI330_17640 [Caldimonas sp.]